MTCIVGIVHNEAVWIGGDSAAGGGTRSVSRADEKVFEVGDSGMIIGGTTSFRMLQLLRFGFSPPVSRVHDDWSDAKVYEWMVTDFIDAVRTRLGQGGFRRKKDEEEIGGTFLVGFRHLLFRIDSDFQVGIPLQGYTACGCGQDVALGALFAQRSGRAERRIETALDAACEFSGFVRRPYTILST